MPHAIVVGAKGVPATPEVLSEAEIEAEAEAGGSTAAEAAGEAGDKIAADDDDPHLRSVDREAS